MKLKQAWLTAGLMVLTSVAQADTTQELMRSFVKDVKPGLWEVQQKTAIDGQKMPDMSKMLEKVPPEMRAQVEAMMSKKASSMAMGKPIQVCLTKEQLEKQTDPNNTQNRCQFSNIQRDGNVTHVNVQCNKPKAQGETTVTRLNSEAWTSVTKMTVEEQGSAHAVNSEANAHWVSADCSAIKQVDEAEAQKQKQLRKQQEQELRRAAAQALQENNRGE